jgi:hypothetical protein
MFAPIPRGGTALVLLVREAPAVYRPRRPERTAFYRLLDMHFEAYRMVHEERFEPRHGPLRPVVPKVVAQYLDCGRLHAGFARVRCPRCRAEHLLAFSCQTRNFCPSCQAKRAALFAEKLREEILAPVDHRHMVFTIPRVLRGLFERERRLLGLLSRCAFEAVTRCYRAALGRSAGVPGYVGSIQTFGGRANFHPHVHALVSEGLFTREGEFLPLLDYDRELERAIEEGFRRLVLTRLFREERLSSRFLDNLLTWRRSGFSVFGRQRIPNEEPARLAHMARYLVRPPVATGRVSSSPDGRVLLEVPADPATGAEVLVLDPLEWVHRITTQIPDPRRHLVRYAGAYANRCRRQYRREGHGVRVVAPVREDEPPRTGRASWARLLRRLFEVDPLLCPACGAEMKVVWVITEPRVIDGILRHLEKSGKPDPFDARAPPAA